VTSPVATDQFPPADDAIYCPSCGYDLRGIDHSLQCPECGLSLDRARLNASAIPWTHREDIGRVRAYVRTVAMIIRRPTHAAGDVSRPVSLDDARRFRRATALIAMIGPTALIVWGVGFLLRDWDSRYAADSPTGTALGWLLELALGPVVFIALYAFFLAAGGVASYFFHPRWLPVDRQNRAIALSYYACAPMALTPLTMASIALGWFLIGNDVVTPGDIVPYVIVLAACSIVPFVQAFALLTCPMRMLQGTTHCGAGRAVALAVGLPILWALLAAVIAVGIPAAYLYVSLIVMSLVA
jgi:hypothetical protein